MRKGSCGSTTKALITVQQRSPALLNEAMAHFQTALKVHASIATSSSQPGGRLILQDRIDSLTYHIARARMAQGDVLYEELVRMRPPSGLVFYKEKNQKTTGAEQRFVLRLGFAAVSTASRKSGSRRLATPSAIT